MSRRFATALVLVLLSGCSCEEEPPVGKQKGETCATSEECEDLLACGLDGLCGCPSTVATCGDACCAPGEACMEGQCEAVCVVASGTRRPCGDICCQSEEVCDQGVCVAACATVVCNGTCCGAGEQCVDGGCCPVANQCGNACCGDGQVCSGGQCRTDCGGGALGCGPQDTCCGADEICYLEQCVVPGDPCTPGVACATRPDERPCPDGEICDPSLMRCVPQAVNQDCVYEPPAGVFDPVPLFTWGQRRERACMNDGDCQKAETCQGGTCTISWPHVTPAGDDMPDHYQATSTPMVADLDGDCVPEVVFTSFAQSAFTTNGVLRAIRGDTGAKVWTVSDPAYRTDGTSNPAIGDVDGDGTPEVFVTGPQKNVLRIAADGTPVWISDAFAGPEGSGSITLANLDGAGHAEIIIGAAVFDSGGRLLWEGGAGVGIAGQGPISCVADLDGDDRPELIAGKTVYEFTGSVAGGDFAGAVRVESATNDGYCGIADMDGAPGPEVVLVTGGQVYVLQGQTMATLASFSIPGGGNGGAPNIADFDGDGRPDIGTAGANNYVVLRYPSPDTLELLWRAPTEDDSSSRTGSSVFDFDGDGKAEVVYNDEEFLRIYPGVEPDCQASPPGPACDGVMNDDEILFLDLNSSRTRTEYPVIADIDGDFKAEIVFATSNEANFLDPGLVGDAGIEVWADRLDNWVPTRPVWNQHSYHITNAGPRAQIPEVEEDSWTTPAAAPYNSYRRNAQGGRQALCAPDLVVRDIVQDEGACPNLGVAVTVVNQGCLGVGPGLAVTLFDSTGQAIGTVNTTAALGPGSATIVTFEGTREAPWNDELSATVDDDGAGNGAFNECEEGNNRSDPAPAACRLDI